MDQVNEGRTYYRDKAGNEITREEYERLQSGADAGTKSPLPVGEANSLSPLPEGEGQGEGKVKPETETE